jgi:cysteine desulfurase
MKTVYLDHNATCPVFPEVVEAMLPYYGQHFGNASSVHVFGQEARRAVEDSRDKIAALLNARPEELFFTSGGTESDNLAIKGFFAANKDKGKHIITSSIEHPAVLEVCRFIEKNGYSATYLPVNSLGVINPAELERAVTKDTSIISVMYANNETGSIQPVEEMAQFAKSKNIVFHTDAVQAVGKLPIDLNKTAVDMLSASAHKFYGPKGIGFVYIRKGTKIECIQHGGHHERNIRPGTENVPGIVGMAKALEISVGAMKKDGERVLKLRDMLWEGIKAKIDHVFLNGHAEKRTNNTLNVSFQYIESESIILNLDLKGIAVSGGSACASGSAEPSHVLGAMGVDPACAQGAIRFSLGKGNSKEDIEYVLEVLPPIIKKLRAMSPIYTKSSGK